ncbi:hypothetical protein TRIATDRAFT_315374 [Trichoderma atroviride IMI 206040]|uniref:Uncharacterized protein n=1 Tax=Hypocrea atroviridis (strain ATCC 20476 / IMI 206040) TaxID=452589 RepID=G9NJD7_HYPAI|nr:uncharacterized protein TRIATDRAFT_315374 [Trichoderma atroviride IMI 206040]EHK49011.1 hypothetical protein TRIATDRAFT_315374 [Trichoderma atroviride IMI 206040]
MSDSNKSKDSQRPANNTGPNPKRRRTIDRSGERSPVTQRDGAEASSPTVSTVPHRQRNPDAPRQNVSNALPKTAAHHTSAASLKTLMYQFFENFESFQLRSRAVKHLKHYSKIQEQSHHRLSDFSSASNLQMNERKAAQDDIEKADKQITDFCNKISPALRSILQGISEGGGIGATPSSTPDRPMVSEAKLNTVQDTIKKDLETAVKKDIAESQQSMKDFFQSQTSALKEALSQEYEQQFKSLKETLMQECEERQTSHKKTLTQEEEERVKSLKKSLAQEEEERVKSLKNSLAQDYEKRIADIRLSVAQENRDQIADLKKGLANESEKNTALEKKMVDLKTELDKATSGQRQKLESLVEQTHLDQQLQRLSSSQEDKLGEIRTYVDQKTENTFYVQRLKRVDLLTDSHKEKLGQLEDRLNQAEDDARRIENLEVQICNLSRLINKKAHQLSDSQEEKVGELEASLNRLKDDNVATHQLLTSQNDKLSKLDDPKATTASIEDLKKLEARMDSLASDTPKINDFIKEWRVHLELIEKGAQLFNTRLVSLESVASTLSAKELDDIRTEMAKMDQRIRNFNPKHESLPLSADSIRHAIWLEVEKEMENKANATKAALAHVQSGLHKFLKTEREEREALEAQCAEVTRQLLEAQQEAAATKSELWELKKRMNDPTLKQDKLLDCFEEKLNSRIGAVVFEFRNALDGICLHIQGLGAWQNNFSTKGLYKDILNYINATMPDGTVVQLRRLKQRMEVAETRIAACENGTSNKRRKLPSGGSKMVSGDQADA